VRHPWRFARGVVEYRIVPAPAALALAVILPYVELLVGVALVTGLFVGIALPAATALFGLFFVAVAVILRRQDDVTCYCFGAASGEKVSPRSLARLGFLLAAALLANVALVVAPTSPVDGATRAYAATVALFWIAGGLWLLHAPTVVGMLRLTRR
jgi:hypothetical protein